MKTVLFISHTSEINGAELMLLQSLHSLNRSKFCPLLVLPRPGPLEDQAKASGVETLLVPSKWWLTEKAKIWKQPFSWIWSMRGVYRLARLIDNRNIGVVFSNSSASFSGALAAKMKRIPHVWAVHEILRGKTPQLFFLFGQKVLIRLILSWSCRIVVSSRAAGIHFGESEKVKLVYSGVDLYPDSQYDAKNIRNKFNLAEDDIVLGLVGRICEEKGQREMISALAMLHKEYPQLKILLVGRVKSKNYFSGLQKFIARENLGDHVIFTGFQKDVLSLLKAMDCLFVASRMESFGRTVIESMSVHTPVIAVRSGGIPEIITHKKNGVLLDSREPKVLKEAIVSFIHERLTYERAADEGLQAVKDRFLLKHQANALERTLEECLG